MTLLDRAKEGLRLEDVVGEAEEEKTDETAQEIAAEIIRLLKDTDKFARVVVALGEALPDIEALARGDAAAVSDTMQTRVAALQAMLDEES